MPENPNVLVERSIRDLGSLLDDLERARVANGNRIQAAKSDLGEQPPHLDLVQEAVVAAEKAAVEQLEQAWSQHTLRPWQETVPGLGAKLAARLIAVVGDPTLRGLGHFELVSPKSKKKRWVIDEYVERNCGKFLAYCGNGDPGRSRLSKGATQEEVFASGNPGAKMAAHKVGAQFVKSPTCPAHRKRSKLKKEAELGEYWEPPPPDCTCAELGYKYRVLYDEWRVRYLGHVHEAACPMCGPSGKPALPGSEWSSAHQNKAALRNMTKAFLKELYGEAARLREREREPALV